MAVNLKVGSENAATEPTEEENKLRAAIAVCKNNDMKGMQAAALRAERILNGTEPKGPNGAPSGYRRDGSVDRKMRIETHGPSSGK